MCISLKRMDSENKSTTRTSSRRQRRSLLDHIVDSVANMAPELERETAAVPSTSKSSTRATTSQDEGYYTTESDEQEQQEHQQDKSCKSFVSFWESTSSTPSFTKTAKVDNSTSSLTSSIKLIDLQDLRAEASTSSISSSSENNLTSSFTSSWATSRSHLLVAEEIVSHLENEAMMQQEVVSDETQKEEDMHEHSDQEDMDDAATSSYTASHDPFAKDSKFSVGEDGLITLSSLLSDDEETGAISGSFKNSKRSWMNRAA